MSIELEWLGPIVDKGRPSHQAIEESNESLFEILPSVNKKQRIGKYVALQEALEKV
jgi:hypothetical protein